MHDVCVCVYICARGAARNQHCETIVDRRIIIRKVHTRSRALIYTRDSEQSAWKATREIVKLATISSVGG